MQSDSPSGSQAVGIGEARKHIRLAKNMGQLAPAPTALTPIQNAPQLAGTMPTVLSAVSVPMTPVDLASSPGWFLKAYQMLLSEDLGPAWMQQVRSWARFEEAACYEECEKLGTNCRPPCIAAWIARARSTTYRPDLGKLPSFEQAFGAWWAGLQPEWHREGAGRVLQRKGGNDVEALQHPGKNGLLSVLAALFFWHIHAEKVGGAGWKTRWELAVDDMYWIIAKLCSK